jgi:hypothetical protein
MSTQIVLGSIVLVGIFTVIYLIIYGGSGTTQLNVIDKDETNDKENIVYGDTTTVCSVSPPICTDDDDCSEICGNQDFKCQNIFATVSPSIKKCLPKGTLPNCEGEKVLSYAQDDNSLEWECKCNWPTWVNGNCTVDDKLPGICENGKLQHVSPNMNPSTTSKCICDEGYILACTIKDNKPNCIRESQMPFMRDTYTESPFPDDHTCNKNWRPFRPPPPLRGPGRLALRGQSFRPASFRPNQTIIESIEYNAGNIVVGIIVAYVIMIGGLYIYKKNKN